MRFTQSVDMALHALWYMARNKCHEPIQIKDLAKRVHASETYLARVMHWLTKFGIVKSIRGKNGGFIFKRSPEEITIADVVMAIDADA
ncbi:Rrf2 family transcriptional regulator, partial [bacterium]|nr:Rrf2 family transcriptional regulator [bacterium]